MLPGAQDAVSFDVGVGMSGVWSEGGSMMPCVGAAVASSDVEPAMLVVGAKMCGWEMGFFRKSGRTKGQGRPARNSGAGLRVTE